MDASSSMTALDVETVVRALSRGREAWKYLWLRRRKSLDYLYIQNSATFPGPLPFRNIEEPEWIAAP